MSNLIAVVKSATINEVVEGVITSTGLTYNAYQANDSVNITAMGVAFNIYKSVQGALASSIGSMPLATVNKFLFTITQGKSNDAVDEIVQDVAAIITSKRNQSMLTSRTILCADKPFDGLCLGVAKKKKGAVGRDIHNLFTMVKIANDSQLDRYNIQNSMAESLCTRDLTLTMSGKDKADMDNLLELLATQNLLMPKYASILDAKVLEITDNYNQQIALEKAATKPAEAPEAKDGGANKDDEKQAPVKSPDQVAYETMHEVLTGMSSIEAMQDALVLLHSEVARLAAERELAEKAAA